LSTTLKQSATLKSIQKSGWGGLLAASLGALAIDTVSFAIAIAIGGALGLGSFFGADIYFARVFRRGGPSVRWWHHVLYGARFIALLALVACAIAWGELSVIGIVIGLSAPVLGIVLFGACTLFKGEAALRT